MRPRSPLAFQVNQQRGETKRGAQPADISARLTLRLPAAIHPEMTQLQPVGIHAFAPIGRENNGVQSHGRRLSPELALFFCAGQSVYRFQIKKRAVLQDRSLFELIAPTELLLGTALFCPADIDLGEKSSRKSGSNNHAGRMLVSAKGEKLIWWPRRKKNWRCMTNPSILRRHDSAHFR